MKQWSKKVAVIGLSTALCLSYMGASIYAATNSNKTDENEKIDDSKTLVSKIEEESGLEEGHISKDETVYVISGSDGAVQKVIVSDWIKNGIKSEKVSDFSSLQNVENVKGDEKAKIDGKNILWDAQGNDIYYRGDINKELPVELAVSYTLDGKDIKPAQLSGKSGKVTIRFDYTNRQYEMMSINGKEEKIYVPFAAVTGMILDSDSFRNVEVSNGKLINDGDKTIVMGFALPGLQDNLAISKDKLDIPDYVEIKADVEDFRMGMTVTLVSNEFFNGSDRIDTSSVGQLSDNMGKLDEGMNRLLNGSSDLYEGLSTLMDKSGEMSDGIKALAGGAKAVNQGAGDLNLGASKVKVGAHDLSQGLESLTENNDALKGGAEQVFKSLLKTATEQIKAAGLSVDTLTIENYGQVLDELIGGLDENKVYEQALEQVTKAVEEKRPDIKQAVTENVKAQVEEQVTAQVEAQVRTEVTEAVTAGMTEEQKNSEDVQSLIDSNVNARMESDEVKQAVKSAVEQQMETAQIKNTIEQNVELQVQKAISENMASEEVQSKLSAASEGSRAIIDLKASLDSYNGFYLGLLSYTDGVSQAAAGAKTLEQGASQLKEGAAQLKDGTGTLYAGVKTLKEGTPALIDGISKLKEGSMQLSDGLNQFNKDGISKLIKALDGDLGDIKDRLDATAHVSQNYRSFSGIKGRMTGQVKFIYRTDEIE